MTSGCGVKSSYTRPQSDIGTIHRIAVLTFENYTFDQHADDKIRAKVIIELLARGFEVIEEGEVARVLRELKVGSIADITLSEIQALGSSLKVDAVIKGSVAELSMKKGVTVNYPEASINLELINSVSGDIVWSISNSVGGPSFWTRHFGTEGMTLDEAANMVVKEAINTLK